jgi:hypothetical protein
VTLSEASREFLRRYYDWSLSVAESEARAGFPSLQIFKGGLTWKTYQFAQKLSEADRLLFVRARLKRYAAKDFGTVEPVSKQEQALLDQHQMFYMRQRGLELEIPRRRRAGEKIKLASKKTLYKAITEKFVSAFGDRGVEVEPNLHNGVGFEFTCAGWVIITTFTSGRSAGEMDYRHLIAGEAGRVNPDNTVTFPAPVLAMFAWTRIASIQWEYLLDEDVGPACDSAVELCRQVFDALPELLKGIERDKVTLD